MVRFRTLKAGRGLLPGRGGPGTMLAPALRQDLLERLDALARPAGEVAQGPLLELVVDLFLAQSEVEEPERRRACLDLALSLVPRAAPDPLRAIASRPGLTEDVADDAATGTRSRCWSRTAAP